MQEQIVYFPQLFFIFSTYEHEHEQELQLKY